MDSVAALLFDEFELLDVFGPLEAFRHLAESGKCRLITVAERAGAIASRQGPERSPITTSRTVRNFRPAHFDVLVAGRAQLSTTLRTSTTTGRRQTILSGFHLAAVICGGYESWP
jgi:putative intracellular protease/amidase